MDFVNYYLKHPSEPIHPLVLLARVQGEAPVQQRSAAFDDAEATRKHLRELERLRAVIESHEASPAERQDAEEMLTEMEQSAADIHHRTMDGAVKASRSVRQAIRRVCLSLAQAQDHSQRDQHQYALCRRLGFWEVTFEGRHATFQHESGAPYVARLLLHPPPKPIHALALALDARTLFGPTPTAAEVIQQRLLGLEEAGTVRSLRRRERELEAVLDDDEEMEPVKAEALGELEAIADFMRKNPWRSRDCVQKCAQAVSRAIGCLHARLASALDSEGKPDPVLQTFARHLNEHLLIPSEGGGIQGRFRVGCSATIRNGLW